MNVWSNPWQIKIINGDTFFNYFVFLFSNFGKLSQSTKLFNWKWLNLASYLLILPTKWQNWLLESAFALYLPICVKFMKPRQKDIKIFLALQQGVRTYEVIDIRHTITVEWGDGLATKIFQCVVALFWKKLEKMSFV